MTMETNLPVPPFIYDRSLNLYYLHELHKHIGNKVAEQFLEDCGVDIPITSGMWGGSYMVADEVGKSRTNVVRLYCIVSLPQKSPLDEKETFDRFIKIYYENIHQTFKRYGLHLGDPMWGEPVPYTNRARPNVTLQMWDQTGRVKFLRAFFVWNTATWEESIIYDMVRNIKQIKQLLNLNHRPPRKSPEELKFLLQDVLIIYYTLRAALNPDFIEHAEPIVRDLLDHFLSGLHDPEEIEELYHKVYSNALVYGFEEGMEEPYKKAHLDIGRIETWPVEKINWVPPELREKLGPHLLKTFDKFRINLEKKKTGIPNTS